jgi:hypothetical protein
MGCSSPWKVREGSSLLVIKLFNTLGEPRRLSLIPGHCGVDVLEYVVTTNSWLDETQEVIVN